MHAHACKLALQGFRTRAGSMVLTPISGDALGELAAGVVCLRRRW